MESDAIVTLKGWIRDGQASKKTLNVDVWKCLKEHEEWLRIWHVQAPTLKDKMPLYVFSLLDPSKKKWYKHITKEIKDDKNSKFTLVT